MLWFHMLTVALRLTWPYLLTPWRSPLLRWRLETYGIHHRDGRLLHAEEIGAEDFFRFLASRRAELMRFLRWAARLS